MSCVIYKADPEESKQIECEKYIDKIKNETYSFSEYFKDTDKYSDWLTKAQECALSVFYNMDVKVIKQ